MASKISDASPSLVDLSVESLDPRMEEALDAAKTWLLECEENHESCRKKPRFSKISDMGDPVFGAAQVVNDLDHASAMPKRLLSFHLHPTEQDAVKLVDVTEPVRYAALSHRWGQDDHCKTTKDNLESMQAEGIPMQNLPRTFREAVEFARGLEIMFLWIDSLCIVQGYNPGDFDQDDHTAVLVSQMFPNRDFMLEAPRMACIYGNSVCTIAAVDGVGSDSGLFPPTGTAAHLSELDSRAWVLQERMIPPRSLFFTKSSLAWECRECNASLNSRSLNPRDGASMDNPKDLFTFFRDWRIPGANVQQNQHMVVYVEDQVTELRAEPEAYRPFMKAWWKFVSLYTTCQLSHDMDKFLAMSGIANTTLRWVHMVNYFGLWGNFFHADLTWFVDKDGPQPSRPKGFLVPSWSWASTRNGRVRNGFWEESTHGKPIMQMKMVARPPQSTSFDLPLPYPPWSSLYSISTDIKGTLRQGTITCTREKDGKPRYDIHLEQYARWSDEEEHEFWPDCPGEFPPGSTVHVHVFHMWHCHQNPDGRYRDIRLVLHKLRHISTDRPPLATAEDDEQNTNLITGRITNGGLRWRMIFEETHHSSQFPEGEVWYHQPLWDESASMSDDNEEFFNGRTFIRKGYLETTYKNRRDMDGINDDFMWHSVRLL